jgi:hypothetical protein
MRTLHSASSPARLALLALVLAWTPAFAQTVYSWEDEEGVHYTDDPSAVPAKARKIEKAKYDEEGPRPKPKPALLARTDAPSEPAPPPVQNSQAAAEQEALWRGKFIDVTRRIAFLKDSLASLAASRPSPVTCGTNFQLRGYCTENPEHVRVRALIAEQTAQLRDAEREAEQLERDASYQSIPREWRRGY